ncbi:hypothetical protein SCLCIDRAFT_1219615 [Scleroderma citrinum Foug A]|uniref:Uncharacterized protein n=1 Tax=Scleroderma citrinum Foug A TaxID=1036808 RepID=A0A0C3D8X4_9AGAM|nr:hypothetical protein SCLCIDRAFT_1219615 [Scleroderma citrinum Foug A]
MSDTWPVPKDSDSNEHCICFTIHICQARIRIRFTGAFRWASEDAEPHIDLILDIMEGWIRGEEIIASTIRVTRWSAEERTNPNIPNDQRSPSAVIARLMVAFPLVLPGSAGFVVADSFALEGTAVAVIAAAVGGFVGTFSLGWARGRPERTY